ncbi:MAG: aspartate-semialdehyde dehydrogenase [Leptolyngbya sp. RL_3_1]|nr:aspartate-semialdehyde dehydrogenase [Leptolyngbya sp. RL_3_1]
MGKLRIGIAGATGAVGTTLLELFIAHQDPVEIVCYASAKSAGKTLTCKDQDFVLQPFDVEHAASCDVVFLCVSGDFSLEYGPLLAKNSTVIDNSSAFRYDPEVPLIVPPVNPHSFTGQTLIANPNCSSAIALVVLAPLHRQYGIEHLTLSTYQAASGAGKPAMEELVARTGAFKDYDRTFKSDYFRHDLAYNVVPHIDQFQANRYTKEEMKMVWEIRKVLEAPDMPIEATAVRVPALRSHAESLSIKFTQPVTSLDAVRSLLAADANVEVRDDIENNVYPMPVTSTYKHAVEVGRIRHSLVYGEYGLNLFVSGDQLLRGAALNAYEIYKLVYK